MSEATALPTEPQPLLLFKKCYIKDFDIADAKCSSIKKVHKRLDLEVWANEPANFSNILLQYAAHQN